MDMSNWRAQLQADSTEKMVNRIMDAMKIHNQISGYEGFQQLNEIPMSIEEKIFLAATTQIQLDNFKSGRFHTMINSDFSLIEVAHIISNMIGLYFFCMRVSALGLY
ncbi:hypothetical protein L2E82_48373 [Cichorium intybus]|uniref:Uncharacterized protein n=1 Tax=Cichorium intybus TaxID=13427 RepID=A0ACB8YX77_CICIN|nr:hypothetical protein L2E82_48373 [Cichorium intybus]